MPGMQNVAACRSRSGLEGLSSDVDNIQTVRVTVSKGDGLFGAFNHWSASSLSHSTF